MMRIKIGTDERELDSIDEQWINQQISKRRADGEEVCVRITIHEGDIDMVLSTPTCPSRSGAGRLARPDEQRVLDLWNQRGLNRSDFTGGKLVAFLKQLRRLL